MELLTHINWVDILIAIVVLRTSYVAFKEGLSHEIFPLFGVIITVAVSLRYFLPLSTFFGDRVIALSPVLLDFASFLALAVCTALIVKLIKILMDKLVSVEWHPLVERGGGVVVGLVRGFVAASLVLMILALTPLPYFQRSIRERSLIGMYVLQIGPHIYSRVLPILPAPAVGVPAPSSAELIAMLSTDKPITQTVRTTPSSGSGQ